MPITFDEDKQNEKVSELRKREEEDLIRTLSDKYSIPYINTSTVAVNPEALKIVSENEARASRLVPFDINNKKLSVALIAPENDVTKKTLESLRSQGYDLELYMTTTENLEISWRSYKDLSHAMESKAGSFEITSEAVTEYVAKIKNLAEVEKEITTIAGSNKLHRVSRILEIMIAGALATKASDIHIEPEEAYARLRFRLDGVLKDLFQLDTETFRLILSRIKLLSGLKLNIKTEAQDGRFSVDVGNSEIEIRTSILPGAYAESVVLRILNPSSISVPLEELGIHPKLLKIILREIEKPKGMLLNTGPTGSGKTTTLYAFLKKIHSPDVKIITIEDPIEYHLPGIVQTQTNPDKGYTFLEGLRSALRQDPDVIMVGEIRDNETARTAIDAALTGHLVFSTLHTNTAAGAFPRLIDLDVSPKIISSAINMIMAQRLVRKLCPECKKEVPIEGDNKKIIDKVTATISDKEDIKNTEKMWVAVGCDKCNKTGYRGRLGIYEAILANENIERVARDNASEREIKKEAESQGIYNLMQDGIVKVLAGVTSLDELGRVVDLYEA